MNSLKERLKYKLRAWLFPEYDRVCCFMIEVEDGKLEVKGKSITFTEPTVLVGNLTDCKVSVKPTIKPEIILSKLDIDAALKVAGNQHMLTHNYFQATAPAAIKLKETAKDV